MIDMTKGGNSRLLQVIGSEQSRPAGAEHRHVEVFGNRLARRPRGMRVGGIVLLKLSRRPDVLRRRLGNDALVALLAVALPQRGNIDRARRNGLGRLATHFNSSLIATS